jgi:hypothetical protein
MCNKQRVFCCDARMEQKEDSSSAFFRYGMQKHDIDCNMLY